MTIGERVPLNAQITLVAPDPQWPVMFAQEHARISAVLGDRALALEHVGSTSVPGLLAKPILDILLVVPDSSDEPAYVPDLEAAGYILRIREPDWHQHRLLKGPDTPINLHVFSPGSAEAPRMLGFRDHLRANPAARDRYAQAKRELAARTWTHVQHYADAKTEVIEAILTEARATDPARQDRPGHESK
ncbi:GrpB family protein [Nannocystis poenicansa]|uniref:GrpB family protein n=1 Tax=Nannocystis punicea TaxID=2995304 RepID=A0ABY7H944_9BACT|nr:GrpB family protein [Nannocystis poenicansa]WAS95787.1 GrpB family protein [Nannocystis poenicansa]